MTLICGVIPSALPSWAVIMVKFRLASLRVTGQECASGVHPIQPVLAATNGDEILSLKILAMSTSGLVLKLKSTDFARWMDCTGNWTTQMWKKPFVWTACGFKTKGLLSNRLPQVGAGGARWARYGRKGACFYDKTIGFVFEPPELRWTCSLRFFSGAFKCAEAL